MLLHSDFEDGDFVSSAQLGDLAAVNGAQVRKDLALFGGVRKQGSRLPVKALREQITKILGATGICLSDIWNRRTGCSHSPLYIRAQAF